MKASIAGNFYSDEDNKDRHLRLQRKQRLQALVIKRKSNLEYIKRFHKGDCFWLNSVFFRQDDISRYIHSSVHPQRTQSYFILGLSIAKLLNLAPGTATVRAWSQLIEEWEYYHAGATMQGMKYMMAKNSNCIYPHFAASESAAELNRPSIYKFHNNVVYQYLEVVHCALDLDYIEVLSSLCDMLIKLYENVLNEEIYNSSILYETLVRLDKRIKHHIINLIAKELTEISNRRIRHTTSQLRSLALPNPPPVIPAPQLGS